MYVLFSEKGYSNNDFLMPFAGYLYVQKALSFELCDDFPIVR